MPKGLDGVDVAILEALATYGPRNISRVAKELDMPRGTVLSRIRRMSSSFYLKLLTTIYHTNLGLKKAVVFARATPGRENLLFDCLRVNEFYIYLSRCFGMFEGCVGIYVIPEEHTREFSGFVDELGRLKVADRIELFWSTCFHTVNRTRTWFEEKRETWVFPWKEWLKEVFSSESDLPYTLKDPESFPAKGDETDLFIVKELEKDATVTLASMARKFGTSLQNLRYHYETHVVKYGLIETFQIAIFPFDMAVSDMFFFILKFADSESMGKFARSLLDKPFAIILGKILGKTSLVCQFYLPREEFRNFVDALSSLARAGFLKSYDYVLQDLRAGKYSRQTIAYEFFKNGAWVYEHSRHLKALHSLISRGMNDPVG